MKRICIYPKDIAQITGKSYRQSLRIHHKIKALHNKQKHQLITFSEALDYLGISIENETTIQ